MILKNLSYRNIGEIPFRKVFKSLARASCFRAADIAAGTFLINIIKRNVSKLACRTVLAGIELAVDADGISETGSDIKTEHGFSIVDFQLIHVIHKEKIYISVKKNRNTELFLKLVAESDIVEPFKVRG